MYIMLFIRCTSNMYYDVYHDIFQMYIKQKYHRYAFIN